METIVVGVDGSDHAAAALRWAIDEARAHKSTLRVVHVWQPPTIEGYPYTRGGFDDRANERAAARGAQPGRSSCRRSRG